MGSEDSFKNETGCQQQPEIIHCANGCGFFGTAATMNLCSKCYRDSQIKEEQSASAKVAVKESLNPKKPLQPTKKIESSPPAPVAVVDSSSSAISSPEEISTDAKPNTGLKNRCSSCKKRVGLTGFKCRCGFTYCSSHRYPEEHSCTFDFKGLGREAITAANPVIKADKIENRL